MKKIDLVGLGGVFIIQCASLPLLFQVWIDGLHVPLAMPLMFCLGLGLMLVNSIKTGAYVYTVSNSAGLTLNAAIVWGLVL